jgi:glycosyltransferase involved in cell wall biosynthesis
MACGTPVLTSNNSSLAEIFSHAAYQVNPLQTGEITHGLQTLLDDPELRVSLSHKGIERASMYSWNRAARQTMQVYRQVLD